MTQNRDHFRGDPTQADVMDTSELPRHSVFNTTAIRPITATSSTESPANPPHPPPPAQTIPMSRALTVSAVTSCGPTRALGSWRGSVSAGLVRRNRGCAFCAGLAAFGYSYDEGAYKFVVKKSLAFFWDVIILTAKIR